MAKSQSRYAYELCVIGSGPAGQRAAIQAAKLGRRVCVIEQREMLGGVAINTGTIPSKALREAILSSGDIRSTTRGQRFSEVRNEQFTGLLDRCASIIRDEVELASEHLMTNGVDVVRGTCRFIGPHKVVVEDGETERPISSEYFVIAVGSKPARPDSVPFDGQNLITSDELLKLPYLPHSMIVIGGGVIGTEYASMLQALGVRVTLIEARDRVLEFVDEELVDALQYHLRNDDMTLRLNEKVVELDIVDPPDGARAANDRMAQVTLESGKKMRADCILYCIGRQGATASLSLAEAGLEADHRGRLEVDEHFRTKVPHIYAAGDVVGFPALASTSMEQGRLAACHMFGEATTLVPTLLPYGIYAIPEISMVGRTEASLMEEGVPYESGYARYEETARGKLLGDRIGMLKILIHQETREVLGVHAIGTGATELIHIGQTAIAFGAKIDYFETAVFNYPTLAECYKIAALNGLNRLRNV